MAFLVTLDVKGQTGVIPVPFVHFDLDLIAFDSLVTSDELVDPKMYQASWTGMLDADLADINSHRASNLFFGLLQCRIYIYGREPLSYGISFESFGSPLFILDLSLFGLLSRDILSLLPCFIFLGSLPMPKRVHVDECLSMLWDSDFNIQGDSDLVAGPERSVTFSNQKFKSQTALASSASRAYFCSSSF